MKKRRIEIERTNKKKLSRYERKEKKIGIRVKMKR